MASGGQFDVSPDTRTARRSGAVRPRMVRSMVKISSMRRNASAATGRLGELGEVEQATAALGPARRFDHRGWLALAVAEVVVARIGVDLHDAGVGGQMLSRVLA